MSSRAGKFPGIASFPSPPVFLFSQLIILFWTGQTVVFVLLSAGSLNGPNDLDVNGRIVFECQHMIGHLISLGVNKSLIFGDPFSWDTVTNGLSLRMYVEGIFSLRTGSAKSRKLGIDVFISDFHAERVQETFGWVLGLAPSVLPLVDVRIHSVSSKGVNWSSKDAFQSRLQHEARGVQQVHENAKQVRTLAELYAFLLLGPHRGLMEYLHGSYRPSAGAGWGAPSAGAG